ncbi:MAG: NUDIX hydrolase [Anaerovoracaceae bacterium]
MSSQRIYEGKILNLRRDKVLAVGEQEAYREIVEHGGGVTIAAITHDGKMVMVRQYRKAAEKVVLEAPAGKKERGEDPELTAIRELKEETGYTPGKIQWIASFYSSIGYSTEVITIYLATDLTPGEMELDENEAIEVLEYDLSQLKEMAIRGEIEDGKTIVAILLAAEKMGI